jgi:hypothetical protein
MLSTCRGICQHLPIKPYMHRDYCCWPVLSIPPLYSPQQRCQCKKFTWGTIYQHVWKVRLQLMLLYKKSLLGPGSLLGRNQPPILRVNLTLICFRSQAEYLASLFPDSVVVKEKHALFPKNYHSATTTFLIVCYKVPCHPWKGCSWKLWKLTGLQCALGLRIGVWRLARQQASKPRIFHYLIF